jgi:hypothetical protein
VAMTRPGQLLQAITQPLGSPTEDPKNSHHIDQDHNDDDFDSNLVGVTIHNLSQSGTILEQSDLYDENN